MEGSVERATRAWKKAKDLGADSPIKATQYIGYIRIYGLYLIELLVYIGILIVIC